MLPQLHSVTKLQPAGHHEDVDPALVESIAICSGLKAFDCLDGFVWIYERPDLSEVFKLTQLTELGAWFSWNFLPELCRMTLLEHLHLDVDLDDDCSLDQALSSMPHLQTVRIKFSGAIWRDDEGWLPGKLRLSGDAFSELHHLRTLLLDGVDIDESFFLVLTSKTGLTKLEFTSLRHSNFARDLMCEVNLLRNLEELTLRLYEEEYTVGDLLKPERLLKLKHLNISGNEDEVEAVRKKFDQSMHPALVNKEKSPWRSRSVFP